MRINKNSLLLALLLIVSASCLLAQKKGEIKNGLSYTLYESTPPFHRLKCAGYDAPRGVSLMEDFGVPEIPGRSEH